MARRIRDAARAVIQCASDFVFDDACHVCGERGRDGGHELDPVRGAVAAAVQVGWVTNHPVCADCAARLETAEGEAVLGWRLPGGAVLMTSGELVGVAAASKSPVPPSSIRVVSAFRTDATLLRLIHLVKFSRLTSLVAGLAAALANAGADVAHRGDRRPVLVPVPMDARSLRRRGFNQAERVAVELGERWSLPVVADAVVKPRPTRPQSLAAHDERLSNVRGAFRPGPGSVAGRDAILVDDLVTTGATAAAVAAILGARGAASVTVASLGRS